MSTDAQTWLYAEPDTPGIAFLPHYLSAAFSSLDSQHIVPGCLNPIYCLLLRTGTPSFISFFISHAHPLPRHLGSDGTTLQLPLHSQDSIFSSGLILGSALKRKEMRQKSTNDILSRPLAPRHLLPCGLVKIWLIMLTSMRTSPPHVRPTVELSQQALWPPPFCPFGMLLSEAS
ncbi:hypothetical protein CFAM422_011571 [Trichoderma lentiforme]|uniref:Uncharacterized protein n=1 Tax=Trichoderma lentiforme TaxID=1567552 RepID=A0A9P5C746_9HYPO|nr:hypothetical protein CFAM422_011571 [Trichoderma lentiforme]